MKWDRVKARLDVIELLTTSTLKPTSWSTVSPALIHLVLHFLDLVLRHLPAINLADFYWIIPGSVDSLLQLLENRVWRVKFLF